jgi:hypothetical protein
MGSSISSLVAEIFLQHFEHTVLKHLFEDGTILYYIRYVDDVLIIFNHNKITEEEILYKVNEIHRNLEFKIMLKNDNLIHFLDLKIIRNKHNIDIDIYRKPSTSNVTIHFNPNHLHEHKLATYWFLLHRLHTLPLSDSKKTEMDSITHIAQSNGFSPIIVHNLNKTVHEYTTLNIICLTHYYYYYNNNNNNNNNNSAINGSPLRIQTP